MSKPFCFICHGTGTIPLKNFRGDVVVPCTCQPKLAALARETRDADRYVRENDPRRTKA